MTTMAMALSFSAPTKADIIMTRKADLVDYKSFMEVLKVRTIIVRPASYKKSGKYLRKSFNTVEQENPNENMGQE